MSSCSLIRIVNHRLLRVLNTYSCIVGVGAKSASLGGQGEELLPCGVLGVLGPDPRLTRLM